MFILGIAFQQEVLVQVEKLVEKNQGDPGLFLLSHFITKPLWLGEEVSSTEAILIVTDND